MRMNTKTNSSVLASTVVAALGGLLFGFDTAVISGTTGALQSYFKLSEAMLGFTVVTALIGTIIGSMAVNRPSDIWGRKRVLIVLAVLYTISAIGSGLAWNLWSFWIFRLIGGLASGSLLWIASAMTGNKVAEYRLTSPPVHDGMALAAGRVYLSLTNGSIICMSPDQ